MDKAEYAKALARSHAAWRKYRHATMIARLAYLENLALASVAARDLPGAVIECGTWKGGMAAGLIEVCGKERDYWFFDSFEGLPPAKEIDGKAALEYQKNTGSSSYFDNCTASLEEFNQVIASTGAERVHTCKGFFEDTFPGLDLNAIGPISVLRLDGDWYDSTKLCLEKFWPNVAVGGIVLIDDYYYWGGCTLAVNEFLAATRPVQRLRQGPLGRVCYLVKAENDAVGAAALEAVG